MPLDALTFLRPSWALALVLIAGAGVILRRFANTVGGWENVVDPALMRAMGAMGRIEGGAGQTSYLLPLLAAAAIVIALTGPAVERRDARAYRNLDGVVFVMDVSRSTTGDKTWQALVTMGRAGVAALGSRPAALIVYAGDAYVASALTADSAQIGQTMALLDEETVPDPGSRPALALRKAAQILADAALVSADVILLSDGAGIGPQALTSAADIADRGGRLSVVHAPTQVSPAAPVAPAALRTLVSIGGGHLYHLADAGRLMKDLQSHSAQRLGRLENRLLFWVDYGRYVLIFALLPVLGLFRRESP